MEKQTNLNNEYFCWFPGSASCCLRGMGACERMRRDDPVQQVQKMKHTSLKGKLHYFCDLPQKVPVTDSQSDNCILIPSEWSLETLSLA